MRRSEERILTTHAGRLPRPAELLERYANGGVEELLSGAVGAIVAQQRRAGIDIVNDGESGKPTDTTNDADHGHGVWAMYVRERLAGLEYVLEGIPAEQVRTTSVGAAGRPSPLGPAPRRDRRADA